MILLVINPSTTTTTDDDDYYDDDGYSGGHDILPADDLSPSSAKVFERFFDWFETHGGWWHESLKLVEYGGSFRDTEATEFLPEGTILGSIPMSIVIDLEVALQSRGGA